MLWQKRKSKAEPGDWERRARVGIISRVVREGLLPRKFKQMKEVEAVTMTMSISLIPVQKREKRGLERSGNVPGSAQQLHGGTREHPESLPFQQQTRSQIMLVQD